jgi:hypothetical protein
MAVKKCKYCNTRMTRVIFGMPTEEDSQNTSEFVEFRGCIVSGPMDKWACSACGASIKQDVTPQTGICLKEAPHELVFAINRFMARVELMADEHDHQQELISLECAFDEDDMDDDKHDDHVRRGDFLRLDLCGCSTFKIYLDGRLVEQIDYYDYYDEHGNTDKTRWESYQSPEFENLAEKLDELMFEGDQLKVIRELVAATYFRRHEDGCYFEEEKASERQWERVAQHTMTGGVPYPDRLTMYAQPTTEDD